VRSEAVVPAVWGALLLVLAALLLFWDDDPLQLGLLAGAAGVAVLVALAVVLRRRAGPSRVPDASPAVAVVALGLALLAAGFAVGPWLLLPGAGLVALGTFGLVRRRGA
jgi:hypothetical protein